MMKVIRWLIHLLELIVSLCNLHKQVDAEEIFKLFFSYEGIGFSKNFHTRCGDDVMLNFVLSGFGLLLHLHLLECPQHSFSCVLVGIVCCIYG